MLLQLIDYTVGEVTALAEALGKDGVVFADTVNINADSYAYIA